MKLLFTFFNPNGGMDTLNRIRCKALRERGHDCRLMYRYDSPGSQNIVDIPLLITNDREAFIQYLIQEQFDVILVCTDFLLLEWIHEAGLQTRVIFEIQGLGMEEVANEIMAQAESSVLRYAQAILSQNTHHLVELLTRRFPNKKLYCLHNPLDPDFRYHNYPPKPYPIIAWVGRLEKNKNCTEFLQIAHRLLKESPEMYIWLFRDLTQYERDERRRFDTVVDELQLDERLITYSNVPHELMADYFSIIGDSGGFLCSTSVVEGFGYAVAEAMVCRCPVLCTDSGGVQNFIIPNVTGQFYPLGDIDAAVQHANQILHNQEYREKLRTHGQAYIARRFSPADYCDQFIRMAEEVLAL